MTVRPVFGTELRRRREAAGMSLADLAGEVHYSKGHLSKVESGSKAANAMLARQCDAALRADGELVALLAGPERRTTPTPGFDDAEPIAGMWRVNLAADGSGNLTMTGDGVSLDGEPALVGGLSLPAGRPDVPPDLVAGAAEARFEYLRSLGQMVSPGYLLPTVFWDTRMMIEFAQHAPPDEAAPLWLLAARYAEYMGWMCQEYGQDAEALRYTTIAVRLAARAGDKSFGPFALFRRADVTLNADDAVQTIELAIRVQTDPAATSRVRGLAAEREAQGHALAGDRVAALRALDRSGELLAEARRAPGRAPVLGTTRNPDPTVTARGWCLIELGRSEEAADLLEPGITGFAGGASRARARHAVRAALARATMDDVTRAAELLDWLADDLRRIDSATVRHDLRLLRDEFRRRTGHGAARAALPLLTDLLRRPVPVAG